MKPLTGLHTSLEISERTGLPAQGGEAGCELRVETASDSYLPAFPVIMIMTSGFGSLQCPLDTLH